MVGAGVVHHKLEPVAVWEEGLELAFPGLVAGIHTRVVPGLLLLLRLGNIAISIQGTDSTHYPTPTYQQVKLGEPNTQAVGAAVTQPQHPTLPLIGAASVATLALTHDTTQLNCRLFNHNY